LHRWILAPGVTTTRPPGDFPTGVRVDYVVAGSYATRVDGPLLVARAGAIDAPESIAPGKEVRLGPGDAALYPQNDAGQTWGNAGTAPLELLVAGVFAAALPPPPAGLVAAELAQLLGQEAAWAPIATGPLALTLRRMSLAPGAELPPSAPPGPELVAVEAGVLGVAAVHAGSDAAAGRERFVVAGQGTALAPPAAGTLRVLRNADTSGRPLAFLVLTLAPAAGGAATPDA
jgi:hypothetical protein